MRPANEPELQGNLFSSRLDQIIHLEHPLARLARQMHWEEFDQEFGLCYDPENGRPGISTRLMTGLHYLKYANDLSDEATVEGFLENPYWQYFCGETFFQHQLPIDSSTMTRWRKRIGEKGAEKLLKQTIETAVQRGYLKPQQCKAVIVDTTVQEKNIAFPTDCRLYQKALETLVRKARKRKIRIRQSYSRNGKKALRDYGRYAHARQMKRANQQKRKLKTWLGRVIREIERMPELIDLQLANDLDIAKRIHIQEKDSKNKVYSVHAPEVECISKGKAHKKYEFGVKASIATTHQNNWIVGAMTCPGNPYDGHTLENALRQVQKFTGVVPEKSYCDKGYRGVKLNENISCEIIIPGKKSKTRLERRKIKRRSAIEPIIGHMKNDYRMERSRLKGKIGDALNVLFSAAGCNLKKLLRAFFHLIFPLLLFRLNPPDHLQIPTPLSWRLA